MNKFDKDIEFYVLLKEGKYFLIYFLTIKVSHGPRVKYNVFQHCLSLSLSYQIKEIYGKVTIRHSLCSRGCLMYNFKSSNRKHRSGSIKSINFFLTRSNTMHTLWWYFRKKL